MTEGNRVHSPRGSPDSSPQGLLVSLLASTAAVCLCAAYRGSDSNLRRASLPAPVTDRMRDADDTDYFGLMV